MEEIKKYVEENKERFLNELFELIRIPSISSLSEHKPDMYRCAEQWTKIMLAAGADRAEVYETEGNPVAYGEKIIDPALPTVLVYGHMDVMPVDPIELWNTKPFEPVIKDGKIWARGADDDKGQAFMHAKAFEYLMKSGKLNCNVKFMIEGEEEIGSPSLPKFCRDHKDMLKADVILVSESGKPMKRETDLIDVWFDSGAMPYAQIHYPFENKEIFDDRKVYPADFIAEGVDQTRGWFFTLHAIATMVFDSVSYKAVVSNGLVLDKNGNKMSKRLGNAVDPFATIEQYGSDPLRWYMITNASPWDNIKFDIDGIEEVRRKFFGTLYNTYSFFALYANVDGFDYSEPDVDWKERPEIDRWILSLLNSLVKDVDGFLDTYEPTRAGRAISDFVNDNLSNWYVRLNRRRFWGGGMTTDKLSAYQTLYTCLETVAKLMAPIAPFYADRLFCDLIAATGREKVESVHLSEFPVCNEAMIDKDLEERMQMAQDVSSMVLALRRKVNIKVRQPLQTIMVPVVDAHQQESIEAVKALILNEVNVKELKFVDNAAGILVKKIKPDFKKLGPRYGKIMKALAAAIQAMSQDEINAFEKAGTFTLTVEGQEAMIERADVEIISEDIPGWLVANEGRLTVALDITVTENLRKEGLARELVNRIQNLRKSSGYDITDKISVTVLSNDGMDEAIKDFNSYIANQVLAVSVEITDVISDATEMDFEDFKLSVRIEKA